MAQEKSGLAAALAKAQAVLKGAVADSANPFYKSKYADLGSVWEAIRKPLTDNGLSVAQTVEGTHDAPVLKTVLLHADGERIESVMPLYLKEKSPQALGSALTYARRYSLAALVGVVQEDDDAEAAHGRKAPEPTPPPPQDPRKTPVQIHTASLTSAKTMDELAAAWKNVPVNHREALQSLKDQRKAHLEAK